MKLLIVCILLSVLKDSEAASASSTAIWKVYDDHHDACIFMEATIGLNLSYVLQGSSVTVSSCIMIKIYYFSLLITILIVFSKYYFRNMRTFLCRVL